MHDGFPLLNATSWHNYMLYRLHLLLHTIHTFWFWRFFFILLYYYLNYKTITRCITNDGMISAHCKVYTLYQLEILNNTYDWQYRKDTSSHRNRDYDNSSSVFSLIISNLNFIFSTNAPSTPTLTEAKFELLCVQYTYLMT